MSQVLQASQWKPRRISIDDLLIKEDHTIKLPIELSKAPKSQEYLLPQLKERNFTHESITTSIPHQTPKSFKTPPPAKLCVKVKITDTTNNTFKKRQHYHHHPVLILPTPSNSKLHGFAKFNKETAKRQRRGPSCDLCRTKKMKCDALVQVLVHISSPDFPKQNLKLNNQRITNDEIIKRYLNDDEIRDGFVLLFSRDKLIKFRGCTFCDSKCTKCEFHKGYTKDEVLVYNILKSNDQEILPKN